MVWKLSRTVFKKLRFHLNLTMMVLADCESHTISKIAIVRHGNLDAQYYRFYKDDQLEFRKTRISIVYSVSKLLH